MRWEIIAAVDAVAARGEEGPLLAAGNVNVGQPLLQVLQERDLAVGGIDLIEPVDVGRTLPVAAEHWGAVGQSHAAHVVLRHVDARNLPRLRVEAEETAQVAVEGVEIDVAVVWTPLHGLNARIEVAGERRGLARLTVDGVELIVEHARRASFGQVHADAAEALR